MISKPINQDFEATQEIKEIGSSQRTEMTWEDMSSNEPIIKKTVI